MFDSSESVFSPQTLLWLIGTVIATALLLAAINRRRTRLTESLREFVDRQQDQAPSSRSNQNDDSSAE